VRERVGVSVCGGWTGQTHRIYTLSIVVTHTHIHRQTDRQTQPPPLNTHTHAHRVFGFKIVGLGPRNPLIGTPH